MRRRACDAAKGRTLGPPRWLLKGRSRAALGRGRCQAAFSSTTAGRRGCRLATRACRSSRAARDEGRSPATAAASRSGPGRRRRWRGSCRGLHAARLSSQSDAGGRSATSSVRRKPQAEVDHGHAPPLRRLWQAGSPGAVRRRGGTGTEHGGEDIRRKEPPAARKPMKAGLLEPLDVLVVCIGSRRGEGAGGADTSGKISGPRTEPVPNKGKSRSIPRLWRIATRRICMVASARDSASAGRRARRGARRRRAAIPAAPAMSATSTAAATQSPHARRRARASIRPGEAHHQRRGGRGDRAAARPSPDERYDSEQQRTAAVSRG